MSRNYLVFSDDWGMHPSSCQHLFKRIAEHNTVVWVNTIMRLPSFSFSDIKKLIRKLRPKSSSDNKSSLNVTVVRPLMIPVFSPFFRRINKWLIVKQLKNTLRLLNIDTFTIVTTIPVVADVVNHLGAQRIVYYCVDEFSEWPGHNREQMKSMERVLLGVCHVVITTSNTLYESKKGFSQKIFCLPHGVDIAHFKNNKKKFNINVPGLLLGYYGLFDERNDIGLIKFLLEKQPDWHIIIVGEARVDTAEFSNFKNITFYGSVEYAKLPMIVNNFHICLLPYHVDALTENINPLKFKEYLATGKPVVSTALPDLKQYADVIGWSESREEFRDNITAFLKEDNVKRQQRLKRTQYYLQGQSWEDKAKEFVRYMHEEGTEKR